jgi:hypothetical protein
VVASDYEEPSILANIRFNASHALTDEEQKRVHVMPLTWGSEPHEDDILEYVFCLATFWLPRPNHSIVPDRFDKIIACDCVWVGYARTFWLLAASTADTGAEDALIQSMTRLLKKTEDARVVVCCGFHTCEGHSLAESD